MWETTNRDRSWYHFNCGNLELCIATRAKKDIENGRVCKWNIYMMFNDCHYSYVQINNEFSGTVDEAKQYAENYLKNLKEDIPL
jgi:hypothetical protein